MLMLDLHDAKFTFATHNMNWNRKCYPFLGFYCQRGDSFLKDYAYRVINDEERAACYENEAIEQEEIDKSTEDPRILEHVDWCHEKNFGVNNFGLHPKYLPLSKIRHNVGLHMVCAIVRKELLFLRQDFDFYSEKNIVFDFFVVFGKRHATATNFAMMKHIHVLMVLIFKSSYRSYFFQFR